jgi:hypothetical protein
MSREVSVGPNIESQVKHAENMARQHYAMNEDCNACAAILATLRRVALLERVAEAGKEVERLLGDKGFMDITDPRDMGMQSWMACYARLRAALAALRDHDNLGKEG